MSGSLRATIAGGSLGGLMAGLELLAAGVDVQIFERSGRVLDDRGAGIVMQPQTLSILTERCGLEESETGTWIRYRQYLNRDGSVASHQTMPQLMTSWGLLYRALRSAFPAERYHEGAPLTSFSQGPDGVTATFASQGEKLCDLLVGADGSRSFVRQHFSPDTAPHYAGYVAWRGVVDESALPETLLQTFDDHFTFQQMPGSHILCYPIPGALGELERGTRRLNWVWYWNVPEAELPDVLTGEDGKLHDFSVPPGEVRAPLLQAQTRVAETMLAPQFQALWQATRHPFIQPILDLSTNRMVFDRTILLGDAAFIPRPHTAGSTAKTAANALALGQAIAERPDDLNAALRAWEPAQLALGRRLESQGRALGNRSQFGRD